jgi:hypothetical protein
MRIGSAGSTPGRPSADIDPGRGNLALTLFARPESHFSLSTN